MPLACNSLNGNIALMIKLRELPFAFRRVNVGQLSSSSHRFEADPGYTTRYFESNSCFFKAQLRSSMFVVRLYDASQKITTYARTISIPSCTMFLKGNNIGFAEFEGKKAFTTFDYLMITGTKRAIELYKGKLAV